MTIAEIVQKVNKTKEFEEKVYLTNFAEKVFDLYPDEWIEETRLTSYYLSDWQCTDTRVGYRVYYFDDKPVAIGHQLARKTGNWIEWLSEEDYYKVKDYVLTFVEKNIETIPLANLEEDFGESYQISYYSQLYKHHLDNVTYNNSSVKIIKQDYGYAADTVEIEYPSGKREWVDIDELSFPYNLQK